MSEATLTQIGMIGVGHMGRPLAHNLLNAGYALSAYDKDPGARMRLLQLNGYAAIANSVADAAQPGGVVLSMVPDDDALLDIALQKDGILDRLGPGGVHVSLSTISPDLARRLATIYQERGARYVSGTVVGRPDVASEGRLTIYLSGAAQAKARVLPMVQAVAPAGRIADLGEEAASAPVAKLATNSLILAAIAALGEAANFIEAWGGDPIQVLDLIAESPLFGGGAVYKQYGEMIARNDFSNALFPVPLGVKDACLIIDAAQKMRQKMPSTEHAYRALRAALAAGRDAEDWSVLARVVDLTLNEAA